MSFPAAVGRCSFMLPAPSVASAPEPQHLQHCAGINGVHSSRTTSLRCVSDRGRPLQAAAQCSTAWSAEHAADLMCRASDHALWATAGSAPGRRQHTRCRTARMVRPMSYEGDQAAEQASSTPFWLQSALAELVYCLHGAAGAMILGSPACIMRCVLTVLLGGDDPQIVVCRDRGLDQCAGSAEVALAHRRGARARRPGPYARAAGCATLQLSSLQPLLILLTENHV